MKQDAIQVFKDKAVKRGRLTKEEVSVEDAILMDNLHLIDEDGYLMRAAMLAFYKDPEKWVTGSYIKIGYFGKSDSDLIYQDEVNGPLIEQIDKTVDLVYTKYMKALIYYDGLQRVEQYMFHKDAFREILLNAVVHKDYSGCNPIQISVYEDKIYIWNDGEMPANLNSTEKLFAKHSSKPYNPKLANVFFKSGMIEAWGRSFEKIRERKALKSECMIEIWHKNCKKMRAHEIIDTFQEHKVSSCFQKELNMIGRNPEVVYDILFKDVDFSIFTRDTVDFYEDTLSGFLTAYVDGFREKGKRDDIQKKIRILETYVNNIPENYVRNILEKRLFLCRGRYSRWDVDKVKVEYSYKDKSFLNTQIEKYGSIHLKDVLHTVYLLNIDELLPEILLSISSCFEKAISNNKEHFAKEIKDSQVIVDMIMLKSFIFFSDKIKKDVKLTDAYENLLLSLTEIRNEKAAVLLDEFRIH